MSEQYSTTPRDLRSPRIPQRVPIVAATSVKQGAEWGNDSLAPRCRQDTSCLSQPLPSANLGSPPVRCTTGLDSAVLMFALPDSVCFTILHFRLFCPITSQVWTSFSTDNDSPKPLRKTVHAAADIPPEHQLVRQFNHHWPGRRHRSSAGRSPQHQSDRLRQSRWHAQRSAGALQS